MNNYLWRGVRIACIWFSCLISLCWVYFVSDLIIYLGVSFLCALWIDVMVERFKQGG